MPETTSEVVLILLNVTNVIFTSPVTSDRSAIRASHHREVHFWFQNEKGHRGEVVWVKMKPGSKVRDLHRNTNPDCPVEFAPPRITKPVEMWTSVNCRTVL
jgi:hypothetical protein